MIEAFNLHRTVEYLHAVKGSKLIYESDKISSNRFAYFLDHSNDPIEFRRLIRLHLPSATRLVDPIRRVY